MNMMALEAHSINKSFGYGNNTSVILRGVTLHVRTGEVVVLEGPSGSGKTTLLSIIGCILRATSGRVVIGGCQANTSDEYQLAEFRRRHIGFVFQQYNLFPALTARENIEYALQIKGVTSQEASCEADRLLESVGLDDHRHHLPRDLSGGQKQRVAIARALCGNPTVILADEPTANLDSHTGMQIVALFRELAKERGRGLLIVTHDPNVTQSADRLIRIRDGVIGESDGGRES